MTDIALITDHSEQALEKLIEAYKELPRLSGLVTAITNRVQELEDINWDVVQKRLLDYTAPDGTPLHATAEQLEAIGRIVGRGRHGQDDATYLIYIRAQIFLNKSKALRGDVATLLQLIEPATFTYTEFYPCVVIIEYTTPPAADPAVLLDIAQQVVTGGVRLFIVEDDADTGTGDFLLGDDTIGGEVDATHGLSDETELVGGSLAGIW